MVRKNIEFQRSYTSVIEQMKVIKKNIHKIDGEFLVMTNRKYRDLEKQLKVKRRNKILT